MRLSIWSPLPPAPSGIADQVADSLPLLVSRCELVVVVEDPAVVDPDVARGVRLAPPTAVAPGDFDVYHLGNSPAHAYVYRAATTRPGVVVLHEWNLHDLVLHVTLADGGAPAYMREMRRSHGPAGTFVARQVVRGLGGELAARFALNDRVLESSLGVVGTTRFTVEEAARRFPSLPGRHVPLHAPRTPAQLPDRAAARRALDLPQEALVVTAPGLATRAKRLDVAIRATARLLKDHPSLRLVVVGPVDPSLPLATWGAEAGLGPNLVVTGRVGVEDFTRHLAASDIVLALRHPSRGEMSAALLRALAVGRPTLVTAGTPAAREFPEGVVVPIDPGRHEEAELAGMLDALARRPRLCRELGSMARAFVRERHDAESVAVQLLDFLAELLPRREELRRRAAAVRAHDGTRHGELLDELREAGRELGLGELPAGCDEVLATLAGGR